MAQSDTTPRSRRPFVDAPRERGGRGKEGGREGGREFGKRDGKEKREKKSTVDLRVRLNQPNYFVQSTRGGAATGVGVKQISRARILTFLSEWHSC